MYTACSAMIRDQNALCLQIIINMMKFLSVTVSVLRWKLTECKYTRTTYSPIEWQIYKIKQNIFYKQPA